MSVKDWSTAAASNTSINGVNIGENCPYANMNDMGRNIMADVRTEVASFGTVVAAASAPDIAIDGQVHSVSGSTTISAFATAPAGVYRVLYFETAVTLANTSLLTLPGAANITMSAGDKAGMRSLGSGYWTMEWKTPNSIPVPTTLGKHKLWIPAAAMRPDTTIGPASADVRITNLQYFSLDFDQSTTEAAHFTLSMPSSWDEGAVTYIAVWTASSGSGDVTWILQGYAVSNDDAIPASHSSGGQITDTLIATGDLHRSAESSDISIQGTPAANDTVFFRILRFASDGSDTLNADARLIGIELYITTDAAVDTA